jgi:hypothetical protein
MSKPGLIQWYQYLLLLFMLHAYDQRTRAMIKGRGLDQLFSRWDLAEWLERLSANAEAATVLGSIPASSYTVESEGRQMKQCWIQ